MFSKKNSKKSSKKKMQKEATDDEKWWNSVKSMTGSSPDTKYNDGWTEYQSTGGGEDLFTPVDTENLTQAVRPEPTNEMRSFDDDWAMSPHATNQSKLLDAFLKTPIAMAYMRGVDPGLRNNPDLGRGNSKPQISALMSAMREIGDMYNLDLDEVYHQIVDGLSLKKDPRSFALRSALESSMSWVNKKNKAVMPGQPGFAPSGRIGG
jgi:hypothetical protein